MSGRNALLSRLRPLRTPICQKQHEAREGQEHIARSMRTCSLSFNTSAAPWHPQTVGIIGPSMPTVWCVLPEPFSGGVSSVQPPPSAAMTCIGDNMFTMGLRRYVNQAKQGRSGSGSESASGSGPGSGYCRILLTMS